ITSYLNRMGFCAHLSYQECLPQKLHAAVEREERRRLVKLLKERFALDEYLHHLVELDETDARKFYEELAEPRYAEHGDVREVAAALRGLVRTGKTLAEVEALKVQP